MGGERRKTVLVVDDDALVAMNAGTALEGAGYGVILARSGEEAVATVEKSPAIDLILMDIKLGAGMDGTEAAEIILRGHDIPLVFFSSHSRPEIVARTEKITSYGFVLKDAGDAVLLASIRMAFRLSETIHREREKEAQKEAAVQALDREKFLLQAIMDNVPDYVYFKDRDSRFIRINKAHARLFGLSDPAQAAGKTDFDFFTEVHARQAFADEQAIIRSGRPLSKEERETWADRPDTWVLTTKMPLRDEKGEIIGTFGISKDITARKLAEEESQQQLAEKEVLLREVHHRIRNNIAAIDALLNLHLKSVTQPEAAAALQDAIGRVDSMRLLYDKLTLGEGFKDVPVKDYVESLSEMVVALFPDRAKVTVEKRVADFPLDAKRLFPLGIIINELLTNKMKYAFTDRDSGLIVVSLTRQDGRVTLVIEDDGLGPPEGFDAYEARGFGLTLVKMLSRQLRGRFSMEKRAGTRCTLEFPA